MNKINLNDEIKEILFLGPEGTYCEIAKNKFLNNSQTIQKQIPYSTVKSIINYVDNNKNAIGIIPIENSIEGIVRETMDNLLNVKDETLQITAETVIPINHCLVAKTKNITNQNQINMKII